MKSGKILIVDDDTLVLRSLELLFEDDYDVITAVSGADAVNIVTRDRSIDAVILDIRMAKMDGLQTASRIRELDCQLPIVFYTGFPGDYSEEQIEKNRPFDCVLKSERPSRLIRSVGNAVRLHRLSVHNEDLVGLAHSEYGMIGSSPKMLEVYRAIEQVAPTDNPVLILGPTGSGKELVARAIHRRSPRSSGHLAILNCNHKQPDLIESELFGHLRGSFTGATADRIGSCEYADKGTLFLDEIGDLDLTTQAKLLRVVETGEMQKIGTPVAKIVDVRLVCATHRDLPQCIEMGKFREDLYYRLKGVTITLPPLSERREDIPQLVSHFVDAYCMEQGNGIRILAPRALDRFVALDWPGNVRQLGLTVCALLSKTNSSYISDADVVAYLSLPKDTSYGEIDGDFGKRIDDYKRTLILQALSHQGYNVAAAARELRLDPANLRRLMKSLGVQTV